jgi:hypothetical protein
MSDAFYRVGLRQACHDMRLPMAGVLALAEAGEGIADAARAV